MESETKSEHRFGMHDFGRVLDLDIRREAPIRPLLCRTCCSTLKSRCLQLIFNPRIHSVKYIRLKQNGFLFCILSSSFFLFCFFLLVDRSLCIWGEGVDRLNCCLLFTVSLLCFMDANGGIAL